jgi:hypothetical protein
MPIKSRENLIGAYAFLISIILAVVVGVTNLFFGKNEALTQTLTSILAILGLVAGYFVAEKEVKTFLIASVALVLVSFAGLQGGFLSAAVLGIVNVSKIITNILGSLMFIFIPATIVVALKTVFAIAKG